MTLGTSFSIDSALSAATILIVDDEPANVKLLHQVLLHSGYHNIVQTTDPRDVAEIIKTKEIDLAIFDLMMPELSGTDLIPILERELGARCPPVLILTAATSMEARIEALDAGARDYVNKPFSIPELTARVKNLLEMHLLQKWIRDENQLLETRVAERTAALYNTRLEIIRRLGRAAEYRDNETGMHIIRMSKTSALLAEKLGYTASASEDFLNAAPMHDIGKIGIPDRVLLKPGKFSGPEWQIMQTHAQIGADILHGTHSPLLEFAAEIALNHHEKWDGSGYPRGLKGEDIPLSGRIVAVADVYDALRSKRTYKTAWTEAAALDFMLANKGKHFAPNIVDAFLSIRAQVERLVAEHADPV